ncbi:nucleoside kinase [Coprobacter secundus]|uniref:Uridine kinase n=1 Tax=Coprobacter secundus subsp. similis TaxID=2751153 RepID=A0A7G1I133_9BACT|nr:nucleoside kinase [Coprobacter secundus]BCI64108.1 uridine kinase [Coprobacter secundus subsp. similis]
MKDITIYCVNLQKSVQVREGLTLLEIYRLLGVELPHQVLCARVNNKTEDLNYCVYNPKQIEFIDITHGSGSRAYVRSLCFVLYKAIEDIMPGMQLRIEHSISKGYYCEINVQDKISEESIIRIKQRMREIVDADMPFERIECPTKEALEIFRSQGMEDKVALLETSRTLYTIYYRLDNLIDYYYSCLVPSTGYLKVFDLIKYNGGLLLVPPSVDNPQVTSQIVRQEKMLKAFEEYVRFNHIVGLSNVGNLNQAILARRATDLIKVIEALHEKKIAGIADEITEKCKNGEARVILISGPSSSGKTTFSKRLSIQLMTNLLRPVTISLDNYFVNRENTPKDESGDYDYESLYALDLELFNKDLNRLLKGEEVDMPTYNFESGKRIYRGNKLKLDRASVLILEGIHALNPDLTPQIENKLKYRVYVSALTSISIDDHNWIPTGDNRLLRRIIRDYKYRGSTAQSTIARWPSVRRGEEKWIFPYQENADAMFNSSLLFELAVMKRHATPILSAVPRDCPEYGEANRLLKFLDFFLPLAEHEIPPTSLLREFLGGSSFKY